jgi:lipopolysaccharide export system permease protein
MSILHRMILMELLKVFSMSLLGITGILLMAGIVAEASQQGLGPMQVLTIIPLLIPSMLPYTIPATTLFATCVVYGRLSADNEILAIRSAGVNILKVVWPGIVLGLVVSCVTMGLYYRIIPYTHLLLRTIFLKDVQELMYTLLRKEKKIDQPRLEYALFVQRVQGDKLINPIFKKRNKKSGAASPFESVLAAREAVLQVDQSHNKVLVYLREVVPWSPGGAGGIVHEQMQEVPLPEDLAPRGPRKARDMSWREMRERRAELVDEIEQTVSEVALRQAQDHLAQGPIDLPKHLKNLQEFIEDREVNIRLIDAEMNMRPALAFGCLFFVLVGCPVGIWLSKSDYLSAFITCFLPIVVIYYPLMICGSNFAKEGKLHPTVDVWTANAAMGVIALVLFRRLLKN